MKAIGRVAPLFVLIGVVLFPGTNCELDVAWAPVTLPCGKSRASPVPVLPVLAKPALWPPAPELEKPELKPPLPLLKKPELPGPPLL